MKKLITLIAIIVSVYVNIANSQTYLNEKITLFGKEFKIFHKEKGFIYIDLQTGWYDIDEYDYVFLKTTFNDLKEWENSYIYAEKYFTNKNWHDEKEYYPTTKLYVATFSNSLNNAIFYLNKNNTPSSYCTHLKPKYSVSDEEREKLHKIIHKYHCEN